LLLIPAILACRVLPKLIKELVIFAVSFCTGNSASVANSISFCNSCAACCTEIGASTGIRIEKVLLPWLTIVNPIELLPQPAHKRAKTANQYFTSLIFTKNEFYLKFDHVKVALSKEIHLLEYSQDHTHV